MASVVVRLLFVANAYPIFLHWISVGKTLSTVSRSTTTREILSQFSAPLLTGRSSFYQHLSIVISKWGTLLSESAGC